MKMELGRFGKKLQHKIEAYEFQVGVLEDKPHKDPKYHGILDEPELTTYAGGPARKRSSTVGPLSNAEVLVANMERLSINLLWRPFQEKDANIIKFTTAFLKMAMGVPGASLKRVENLLQAVVRNPILRGDYGSNSSSTADIKGFDRHLIDTSQMFQAIKAKAKKRV